LKTSAHSSPVSGERRKKEPTLMSTEKRSMKAKAMRGR